MEMELCSQPSSTSLGLKADLRNHSQLFGLRWHGTAVEDVYPGHNSNLGEDFRQDGPRGPHRGSNIM